MPITYTFYPDLDLAISQFVGIVTFADLQGAHVEFSAKGDVPEKMLEISDLRQVEKFDVSPGVLRNFAEVGAAELARRGMTWRNAILAPDDHSFAMARVYCGQATFEGSEDVHVVRTLAEATDWLGIPRDQLDVQLAE